MDETSGLVYLGCNLVKDLEANMHNLVNQPDVLSSKCDEIIRVFSYVRARLSHREVFLDETREATQEQNMNDHGLQEWLRSNRPNAMELLHEQILGERNALDVHGFIESKIKGSPEPLGLEVMVREIGGREVGSLASIPGAGSGQVQGMDVSDSSRGSHPQRQRGSRKDDGGKRTMRVAAPRMGNTEIPPEDGFTWRKYGQKEILGTRFPRAYYRCTHQKLYNCPAKKQVQRLNEDPYTFEVTYRGDHICHISSTAPSIQPPPSSSSSPLELNQEMIHHHHHHHQQETNNINLPFSHWLSMNINQSSLSEDHHRDGDYQPVADMADFVFNSGGSSSNNNMELIFSSMEAQKWDAEHKQN